MNKNILRKLQLTQLEILIEFDRICRENDLKYQIHYGTLLGAVRHKGFIPWDDDIDVGMLREDYNIFLKLANEKINNKYFIQNHKTDPEYIHSFTRITKNNTVSMQNTYSEIDMHQGIFIDVFPLDKIQNDTLIGALQKKIIIFLREIKRYKIRKVANSSRSRVLKLIKQTIHLLIKPINIQTFNNWETKIAICFKNKETKYV